MNNINDDEINEIIKKKIEHGEPIDIHRIGLENEAGNYDDEIGLYDHIYDSSKESIENGEQSNKFTNNEKAFTNK